MLYLVFIYAMDNSERKVSSENSRLFAVTTDYLRLGLCPLLMFRRFQEERNVDGLPLGRGS
jgi:hypothetical protein